MSSKIDGVPRELLDRLQSQTELSNDWDEVQALLAAPVVERQPVAWMFKNDNNRIERVIWWEPQPDEAPSFWPAPIALYEDPPELAELQATIARLTAENERLARESERVNKSWHGMKRDLDNAKSEIDRPKSDPMAWKVEIDGMTLYQRNPSDLSRSINTPLYTSQPAPVSVRQLQMADVVRAHMEIPGCPVMTSNQCHSLAVKLNACLDKVKELNQ